MGKKKEDKAVAAAEVSAASFDYVPAKDPKSAEAAGIQSRKFGPKAVCLVSRLDHPVTVSYNGQSLIVSPRQGAKHPCIVEDGGLLGALPSGVSKVPVPPKYSN